MKKKRNSKFKQITSELYDDFMMVHPSPYLSCSISLRFPLLAFCGYAWAAAFIAFRTIIKF